METPIARASARLNRAVELIVAALMVALVLDVWLGVIDRYHFHWQLPWPETLARYLMIWAAMLAVSSGIARREHIGLTTVIDRLPFPLRRALLMISDVLALGLFAFLLWFGIGFATGRRQQAGDDLRRLDGAVLRRNPRQRRHLLRADDPRPAARQGSAGRTRNRGDGRMTVALVFIILLVIGTPIGFSVGIAGVVGLISMGGERFLAVAPGKVFAGSTPSPSWPCRSSSWRARS